MNWRRKGCRTIGAAGRRGFALLAVLWIMTGVAVVGLGLSLAARGAIATAHNRMEMTRARWRAEDCVERVRAVLGDALQPDRMPTDFLVEAPRHLDELVTSSAIVDACPGGATLEPIGIAINVNETTDEAFHRFLAWLGTPDRRADSLTDALLDWRDIDDIPRPHGAEREWYAHHRRSLPRNGPLAHTGEMERIRGFDSWLGTPTVARDSARRMLTVEPGRIALERAPAAVLASLPGVTEETTARLMERRLRRAPPLNDVLALGAELSVASRDSLHRHYAELATLITLAPEAWLLTARSGPATTAGLGGPVATIELRLVRAGTRAAIVRRRTSP